MKRYIIYLLLLLIISSCKHSHNNTSQQLICNDNKLYLLSQSSNKVCDFIRIVNIENLKNITLKNTSISCINDIKSILKKDITFKSFLIESNDIIHKYHITLNGNKQVFVLDEGLANIDTSIIINDCDVVLLNNILNKLINDIGGL